MLLIAPMKKHIQICSNIRFKFSYFFKPKTIKSNRVEKERKTLNGRCLQRTAAGLEIVEVHCINFFKHLSYNQL